MRVIDFHVHLPLRDAGGDVERAARILVREMNEVGVSHALAIAIEASPEVFVKHVTPSLLKRALEPVAYDWRALSHPTLYRAMLNPEEAVSDHIKLIQRHVAPSEAVAAAAESSGGRILAVASYCRRSGVDGYLERLERLKGRIVGVKVYPTLHFIRPNDPELEPLMDYLESEGLLLIVHTGCDPGIWELPAFCAYANPSYLEDIARRHKDLVIVAAHMGSYSYLLPGIYFTEALRLARSRDNVYLDTSATTLHQVKIALGRVGPDKLLFGSDYPYYADASMKDIVEAYLSASLPERVKEKILWENAASLLEWVGVKVRVAESTP